MGREVKCICGSEPGCIRLGVGNAVEYQVKCLCGIAGPRKAFNAGAWAYFEEMTRVLKSHNLLVKTLKLADALIEDVVRVRASARLGSADSKYAIGAVSAVLAEIRETLKSAEGC